MVTGFSRLRIAVRIPSQLIQLGKTRVVIADTDADLRTTAPSGGVKWYRPERAASGFATLLTWLGVDGIGLCVASDREAEGLVLVGGDRRTDLGDAGPRSSRPRLRATLRSSRATAFFAFTSRRARFPKPSGMYPGWTVRKGAP